MKLMLTSFGVSHLRRRDIDNPDVFYRMPPVSMAQVNQGFFPDYAVLLLADEIILDKRSYDRLMTGWHPSYSNVAVMIRALYDEGFVRVEDFDSIIGKNREMLDAVLDRDMRDLEAWVAPLKESSAAWREFVELIQEPLRNDIYGRRLEREKLTPEEREKYEQIEMHMHHWLHSVGGHMSYHMMEAHELVDEALGSSRQRRKAEHRKALKEQLSEYLSYVNANLLLSRTFEAGFHDWCDFQPFYREKFLRVVTDSSPGEKEIENVRKLFEVSFPEFTFWHPDTVIEALKDRRIRELRSLVSDACEGKVEFDREFANRVLQEVLKAETSIGRFRNIVSYATLPLGFIPVAGTPIQKVVEEGITRPIVDRKREKFRWFYMISDLAAKARKKLGQQEATGDKQ